MKIFLVGASGTIGQAVVKELGARHDLVTGGSKTGDVQIDITDAASIKTALKKLGKVDAIVSAAGRVKFAPLDQLDAAGFNIGLQDKLMGQVNLVLIGRDFVNDGGSFTLTSGILDTNPIRNGASASMVNGAVNSFCIAAAVELPHAQRINAVCPGVLVESMKDFGPFFRGHEPVPGSRVALAYAKSVEGAQTGRIFRVE
ncbi:MAG: short chain dehydrogenase [Elusimicrobia bacterium]|nr:short chain dehydrogenase [Elusimicrobiota bacterium]